MEDSLKPTQLPIIPITYYAIIKLWIVGFPFIYIFGIKRMELSHSIILLSLLGLQSIYTIFKAHRLQENKDKEISENLLNKKNK